MQVFRLESIDEVHGRDQAGLCCGSADVVEIWISTTGAERPDDATVQRNLCSKVRQMERP